VAKEQESELTANNLCRAPEIVGVSVSEAEVILIAVFNGLES
jgi:hypothetical protein